MKKDKILNAICIAAPILFVFTAVCLFFGNPLSAVLVKQRCETYLENQYPGTDLRIEKISYDFKHLGYTVYVTSPTSTDTHFRLLSNGFGEVTCDYYESAVLSGSNTLARISTDYAELVDTYLKSEDFPFDIDFCSGQITALYGTEATSLEKDFGIDMFTLALDQEYDIQELGAKHGRIRIYVHDQEVSEARAAEMLLCIRTYLDRMGVPFYAIEFTLKPPLNPDGTRSSTEGIYLIDFLSADIYETGLTDRVTAANAEAQAYFARNNSH